jgi:hypothetical protein
MTMVFKRGKSGTVIASRGLIKAEYRAHSDPSLKSTLERLKKAQDKLARIQAEDKAEVKP